jgi:hypothetical protein
MLSRFLKNADSDENIKVSIFYILTIEQKQKTGRTNI